MKLLAKFTGKVTTFNVPPTPSLVVITEVSSGKTTEATAPSDKLLAEGINSNGDEFEILIHEGPGGKPVPTIRKAGAPMEPTSDEYAI